MNSIRQNLWPIFVFTGTFWKEGFAPSMRIVSQNFRQSAKVLTTAEAFSLPPMGSDGNASPLCRAHSGQIVLKTMSLFCPFAFPLPLTLTDLGRQESNPNHSNSKRVAPNRSESQ